MIFQRKRAAPGKESVRQYQHSHSTTAAPIDLLLARLERVRQTGPNRWIASAPTRDDKHPSMTIRELDDGRILIHDHGGDSTEQILAVIGLTFSDLYPDHHVGHQVKPEHRPFPAADVLKAIAFEALVVAAAATALLAGKPFTSADRERLMVAVERLQSALTVAGVRHG